LYESIDPTAGHQLSATFGQLPAELSQLFLDRPSPKGKDKRHNYTGYWNEHKQTEGPMVTGFGEYTAENDRFDGKNGK